MNAVVIHADRTDLATGRMHVVKVTLVVEGHRIVRMDGGPTGYESFILTGSGAAKLDCLCEHGWIACSGTRGRWDRLFVPAREMKRALQELGLV